MNMADTLYLRKLNLDKSLQFGNQYVRKSKLSAWPWHTIITWFDLCVNISN